MRTYVDQRIHGLMWKPNEWDKQTLNCLQFDFILTFDFELQLHKWIYLCISISCMFRPKLCFIDISIFRSKIKNKVNYNLILMFYSIRLQKEFQISSQKLCLILDRVLVQPFGHQKPFGQNQLTNFSVWIYHHRWMNCLNCYLRVEMKTKKYLMIEFFIDNFCLLLIMYDIWNLNNLLISFSNFHR